MTAKDRCLFVEAVLYPYRAWIQQRTDYRNQGKWAQSDVEYWCEEMVGMDRSKRQSMGNLCSMPYADDQLAEYYEIIHSLAGRETGLNENQVSTNCPCLLEQMLEASTGRHASWLLLNISLQTECTVLNLQY